MLVSESADEDIVYLARGAPRRWYKQPQPFGISQAPTRFGQVTYTMQVHEKSPNHNRQRQRLVYEVPSGALCAPHTPLARIYV